MKRFIPFFLALIFALAAPCPVLPAQAEEGAQYAVAAERDVWFYKDANEESGLFILPYTYYVSVVSEGEPFCAVEYLDDTPPYRKITGYCKRDRLTFVDFTPARPYLRRQITVTYTLPDFPSNPAGSGAIGTVEKTFLFYGTYFSGTARYHYVYADGKFDYVPAAEEITYDLNTDYLSPSSGSALPPQEQTAPLSAGQIAALCILAVAVVAAAAFILRGRRKSPPLPEEERSEF